VGVLIILIFLLMSGFCWYNEKRRRQRHPSLFPNDTIEQIQRESPLLDTNQPQSLNPPSPSSGPRLWINSIRRWKNCQHGLPPYSPTRAAESTAGDAAAAASTASAMASTDEPPAYKGIPLIFIFF